eukprot:434782_1
MQSSHKYKPSLSTGIYGAFVMNSTNLDHDQKDNHSQDHSDSQKHNEDNLYNAIYTAAKRADSKYQFVFEPVCNFKGCGNKPDIDPKLMNGDMYICSKHRISIANELKQCGIESVEFESVINSLESGTDLEFINKGKQMEDNDYFLKSYTRIQQQRLQIATQLLLLKKSHPEYWTLKMQHNALKEQADFLVNIHKISNPLLVVAFIMYITHCLWCGGKNCICQWAKRIVEKQMEADKIREKNRKIRAQNREKVKKCKKALKVLSKQFFENGKMLRKCKLKIHENQGLINKYEKDFDATLTSKLQNDCNNLQQNIDEEQKAYDVIVKDVEDFGNTLETMRQELNLATTDLPEIDGEIKKLNDEMDSLPDSEIDKMFAIADKMEKLEEMRSKRENLNKKKHEEEKKRKELEILRKQKEAADMALKIQQEKQKALDKLKREQEKLKQERIRREQEEDDLQFKRACTKAEQLSHQGSAGHVGAFIVYDDRKYFNSGSYGYSTYTDKCYAQYGNYKILKFDSRHRERGNSTGYLMSSPDMEKDLTSIYNSCKNYHCNSFVFETTGRYKIWYYRIDGQACCYNSSNYEKHAILLQ